MSAEDVEARRKLLGARVLAWLFREPREIRGTEDFLHAGMFSVANGFVFDAMCELDREGREITMANLLQLLEEKKELPLMGGERGLQKALNTEIDLDDVHSYVRELAALE